MTNSDKKVEQNQIDFHLEVSVNIYQKQISRMIFIASKHKDKMWFDISKVLDNISEFLSAFEPLVAESFGDSHVLPNMWFFFPPAMWHKSSLCDPSSLYCYESPVWFLLVQSLPFSLGHNSDTQRPANQRQPLTAQVWPMSMPPTAGSRE